jgi:hypothetical protein
VTRIVSSAGSHPDAASRPSDLGNLLLHERRRRRDAVAHRRVSPHAEQSSLFARFASVVSHCMFCGASSPQHASGQM